MLLTRHIRFLVGEFFRNISVIPQSPTSHFLQNRYRILHSYITCCFQCCVQHRETPGKFPWHKMQLRSLPASELFLSRDIIYSIKPVWSHGCSCPIRKLKTGTGKSLGVGGMESINANFQFSNVDEAFIQDLLMYTNERWHKKRDCTVLGTNFSRSVAGRWIAWWRKRRTIDLTFMLRALPCFRSQSLLHTFNTGITAHILPSARKDKKSLPKY